MGDESDTEGVTPGRRSILAGIGGTFAGLGAVQTASGQEEPEWPVGGSDEVLDTFADFGIDCVDGGRQRFDSRGYEFLAQTWAACGDDGIMFVAMVATPETDPPHTVLVGAQLVTVQDVVALSAASGSLEVELDAES